MLLYFLLEVTTRKHFPSLQDNHYFVTAVTASVDTVLATSTLLNDINSYQYPAKGQHISFSEVISRLNGEEKCYRMEVLPSQRRSWRNNGSDCESKCCSEWRNEQEKGQQQVLPVWTPPAETRAFGAERRPSSAGWLSAETGLLTGYSAHKALLNCQYSPCEETS